MFSVSRKEILDLESPFGCGNSPLFTYPFFGEEQLINLTIPPGTSETILESLEIVLCVNISMKTSENSGGCHCYLGVSDEGILKDARKKIQEKLMEMTLNNFEINFHHSWADYQMFIKEENLIVNFEGLNSEEEDAKVVKLKSSREFYNRIQLLLPFFIEAATPIDLKNTKWTIYLSLSTSDDGSFKEEIINGL